MKKLKKFLFAAFTVAILSCLFCQPAFAAISESDVQTQVDAVGKEAVSGNCCPLTGVTTLAGITRLVLQAPAGFSIGV